MKTLKKLLYPVLIGLFLSVFCYSGFRLLAYYRESAQTQAQYDALSQLWQDPVPTVPPQTAPTAPQDPTDPTGSTEPTQDPYAGLTSMTHPVTGETVWMRPSFCPLFQVNPDIVGWIRVPETKIDYPVVQRPEEKDYYLHRDFYGNRASRGCIYAREECLLTADTGTVTLYGHMMNDGTMFADLNNYMSAKYRDRNPYIYLDTLHCPEVYEVICVFKTSATAGQGFGYHLYTQFRNQLELTAFWDECTARQFYDTGLTPTLEDKLLLLSTCEYTLENGRLVILAKRLPQSP